MAKKVNKTDEQFANVEENLSKAGLYIVKNQSKIMKIVGSIILVITIIIGYNTLYPNLDEENASSEMYIAELYFQNNDYDKALNGDSILSIDNIGDTMISFHKGFIKISMKDNFFGTLKVLWEDISSIITQEIKTIQTQKEKKRNEELFNK